MNQSIVAGGDFTFDDVEVGKIERSGTIVLTEAEIIDFAQRFDPLPIHVDKTSAAASPFGDITASGAHMFAIRQRLLHDFAFARGVIASLGVDEVRYRAPLRAGVPCWVEIEFLEKTPSRSKPNRGVVRIGITMFADGAAVLTMIDLALMRRTTPTI